jgi:hypothetical protein
MLPTDARPQYRKLACWNIVFAMTSLALKSEALCCEQPGGLCHLYESGTRTLETLKEGQEKQQLSSFLIRPPPPFPRAWHLQKIKVLRSVITGICWVMSRQCNVWDRYRQIGCVCAVKITMVFSFSFFVSCLAPFYRNCHASTCFIFRRSWFQI